MTLIFIGAQVGSSIQTSEIDALAVTNAKLGANAVSVAKTDFQKVSVKSANEIVNNSSNLQDDDDLSFTVGANEVWQFTLHLFSNSSSVADSKYAFTYPTGTTMVWGHTSSGTVRIETTVYVEGGGGSDEHRMFEGMIFVGSNAGTIQLQWAQDTPEVSNTTLLKGSYLIATKVN